MMQQLGESEPRRSRVLIVGSSGYMGKQLALASLREGHPTFLLLRPEAAARNPNKTQSFLSLRRAGARFLKASLNDFCSLVNALKKVDVVVSAMAEDQLLEQLKLIKAMKEAGNIKRFLPSEYGMDADKFLDCPPPTGDVFVCKRQIRRSIEDAHIPFTYVSANCLAGWFLSGLGQMGRFMPPEEDVMIYGDGNQKVIWVREEDVAAYAIKTIDDDRTINKTVYIRPQLNILSQNEVVQLWEKIQGRTLKKEFIQEQSWVERLKESMSTEEKYVMGFFHLIFFQGKTYNIDIGEDALEASSIYPDHQYETVEEYLSLLSESSL